MISELGRGRHDVEKADYNISRIREDLVEVNNKIEQYEALVDAYADQGNTDAVDQLRSALLFFEQAKSQLEESLAEMHENKIDLESLHNEVLELILKGKNERFEA